MKKIFIILLTLCMVLSFSVPSYAAFSTESYEILFKTKESYENTDYKEIFSDHRNFLKPEVLGLPEIVCVEAYWASYDVNKLPYYILHLSIGFSSPRDAAEICAELVRCGIAEWAVFVSLNDFSDFDKILNLFSPFERNFVKQSADTFGDIDCNKTVAAEDARIALRIATGLENKKDYPYLMGDMDYDGEITASDARQILRVATGLDGYFTTD